MSRNTRIFIVTFICFSWAACTRVYIPGAVRFRDYRVYNLRTDTAMQQWLSPFSDSLNKTMNRPLAVLETDLEKASPEGTLGNLMADALYQQAQFHYGRKPDIAFMNNGGIRLPLIKAGVITTGKIYELFPFDNMLVLVQLKGTVLQQFLDHIAGRGGWPVAGMTMQIMNKKAVQVSIGGKPLDENRTYTIALGDYTANGGDDAWMLKGLPQENKGVLMRDALIEYVELFGKQNKPIRVQLEKRVIYVE